MLHPFSQFAGQALGSLMASSLLAAFLVLAILGLCRLFRGVIGPAARGFLWLVVMLFLLSPWRPSSPLSFEAWFGTAKSPSFHRMDLMADPLPEASLAPDASANRGTAASRAVPVKAQFLGLREWLACLWVAGALVLLSRFVLGLRESRRLLAGAKPCREGDCATLFEECRQDCAPGSRVELWESAQVSSPLVIGWWRPRVLVPADLYSKIGDTGMRQVLLHELAHVRRHDILQSWLMSLLLVFHWFNPLLWLAARRQRVDRELACDAYVLGRSPGMSPMVYGQTMIHLLEQCQQPDVISNAAGILEYKTDIHQRIQMIAEYKNTPLWKRALSTALCGLVAVCALSRPKLAAADSPGSPDKPVQTADGRWEDDVNKPFVTDSALIGAWDSVDFVKSAADFVPGKTHLKREPFLKQLDIFPEGKTSLAWTWTKDYLLHKGDKTASHYEIRELNGATYLFLEWKSGDYVIHHKEPSFYVLKKVSAEPRAMPEPLADKVDYPFVDDPAVAGTRWTSVDFVDTPEKFDPEKLRWRGKLYLDEIVFKAGGKLPEKWGASTWTKGLVLNPSAKTASAYEIREIKGVQYLFFEWKSGDYILRHMKPKYYVLRKAG